MKFNVVLFEPEIPQNTGNISRTCAVTGCSLHLIKPLGFRLDEGRIKRAGLDYWEFLDLRIYESAGDFFKATDGGDYIFYTTKAPRNHTEIAYREDSYLIFGKESAGIPEDMLLRHLDRCVRIPMKDDLRSLNLSNSVGIAVYEAFRQNGFASLNGRGKFSSL